MLDEFVERHDVPDAGGFPQLLLPHGLLVHAATEGT